MKEHRKQQQGKQIVQTLLKKPTLPISSTPLPPPDLKLVQNEIQRIARNYHINLKILKQLTPPPPLNQNNNKTLRKRILTTESQKDQNKWLSIPKRINQDEGISQRYENIGEQYHQQQLWSLKQRNLTQGTNDQNKTWVSPALVRQSKADEEKRLRSKSLKQDILERLQVQATTKVLNRYQNEGGDTEEITKNDFRNRNTLTTVSNDEELINSSYLSKISSNQQQQNQQLYCLTATDSLDHRLVNTQRSSLQFKKLNLKKQQQQQQDTNLPCSMPRFTPALKTIRRYSHHYIQLHHPDRLNMSNLKSGCSTPRYDSLEARATYCTLADKQLSTIITSIPTSHGINSIFQPNYTQMKTEYDNLHTSPGMTLYYFYTDAAREQQLAELHNIK